MSDCNDDIPARVVIQELCAQRDLAFGRCIALAARVSELEAELQAALEARGPVIGLGQHRPSLVN